MVVSRCRLRNLPQHPIAHCCSSWLVPPPKFSGTDRRMPFRDWWMQVEEFLEGQPEEVASAAAIVSG
jgi:hypothetical protein